MRGRSVGRYVVGTIAYITLATMMKNHNDPSTKFKENTWSEEERTHHKQERFYWRVTAISTSLAAMGALITVILSQYSLMESRKAVEQATRQADIAQESDRAVIATVGISWNAPLQKDNEGELYIFFVNVGKSPTSFYINQDVKYYPEATGKYGFTTINTGENVQCQMQNYRDGSTAIFPMPTGNTKTGTIVSKDIINSALGGKGSVVLRGCIFYKDTGKIHRTGFCYIAAQGSVVATLQSSAECDGNFSD